MYGCAYSLDHSDKSLYPMLNFSGSTKRRVVNLGDRRNPRGKNFLEQAKLDRLQREEARQKEKAAQVLATFIRRRLELLAYSNEFLQEWEVSVNGDYSKYTLACRFHFIAKFGQRDDTLPLMSSLRHIFTTRSLDSESYSIYFQALVKSLMKVSDPMPIIDCLSLLCQKFGPPLSRYTKTGDLISLLYQVFIQTEDQKIVDLVFDLHPQCHEFLHFLANVPRNYLLSSDEKIEIVHTALVQDGVSDFISHLTDHQKINLLVNVLIVDNDKSSTFDLTAYASILTSMNFSIQAYPDTDEDHLVKEASESSERVKTIEVSTEDLKIIQTLYSPSYMNHAFRQLINGASNLPLAVHSISLLLWLVPEYSTRVCMMMSITSGLQEWLFTQLSSLQAYDHIKFCENDRLSTSEILELVLSPTQEVFWDLLYIYEQLLSYWVIVANDFENASLNPFDLAQIVDFCHFLRPLCLTLIFCLNESTDISLHGLTQLKESSLSLLNQLYIKNLRLNYLGKDFWKLKLILFEINAMIQVIIEEESLKRNQDSDSSENENWDPTVGFSKYKKSSRRRTAEMTSKLEILSRVPFFIDFFDRVKVFQSLLKADQNSILSRSETVMFYEGINDKLTADIHRETIMEDAYEQFHKVGSNFKNKIQVTFYNEHGPEAGIDGGGLTKELLTSVVSEGFDPKFGLHLFKETEANNELYPNDDIYLKIAKRIDLPKQQQRLNYVKFLGMIVGKCLYESVLIDIGFAPFFLAKWKVAQSSQNCSINDLSYLDRQLYLNLSKLLTMSADDINALDLTFVIDENVDSKILQYDLAPPYGAMTSVSKSNRLQYIHLVANFKLNKSLHVQTKYFLEGLFEIIDAQWLNIFDPFELQMLISGGNDIDVQDWKDNVHYGGYFDDDLTIVLFWEVVEEMSPQERCDLIKFVTSVSRAPLLGFKALTPHFGIHNSGSPDRLPTASTCVNLLKLPDYKDKTLIREKLLYASKANSGFDLS